MKTKFCVLAVVVVLWVWTSVVASVVANPTGVVFRNLSPYVWLWQGVPVEATYTPTPIQSVQHVVCTTPTDAPITAVDLNYSVIHMIGSGVAGGTNANMSAYFSIVLFTSASNTHCYSPLAGVGISYEVIQFVPTLLKHAVVRDMQIVIPPGSNAFADGNTGYTVNLAKSIAFYQGCQVNNNQTTHQMSINTRFVSNTSIRVEKQFGDDGMQCAVGMAEFK